jgi:hypothetical protein
VNLLDDGLVDVVLDSAASGINTVEREGVSIVHPAKFIMIGSGNPAVSARARQAQHPTAWHSRGQGVGNKALTITGLVHQMTAPSCS